MTEPDAVRTAWSPAMVKRRGMMIPSSTSAQFVQNVLSAYEPLDDLEYVSFEYPSDYTLATNPGLERINVLEYVRSEFESLVSDPGARAAMDHVFDVYASIEGRNFNFTDRYRQRWGVCDEPGGIPYLDDAHTPRRIEDMMSSQGMTVPFFNADGSPADGYVNFSVGGIHGAQWNLDLYLRDVAAGRAEAEGFEARHRTWELDLEFREHVNAALEKVRRDFPDPRKLRESGMDPVLLPDGYRVDVADLLTASGRYRAPYGLKALRAREPVKPAEGPSITPFKPSGGIRKRYGLTSVGRMNHEDFSSYYPSMLRNMSAYRNERLQSDPYQELYEKKTVYGDLAKSRPGMHEHYMSLRGGVKLLLNSATGASDMKMTDGRGNNITMNNRILSMRLIGQSVTWLIGEKQTLAGGTMTSTNTDGLYSSLSDDDLNKRILDETAAPINVRIDPEPLLLASKDSNNRIEYDMPRDPDGAEVPLDGTSGLHAWDLSIASIAGGSLAYTLGPNVAKSMNHPPVYDFVASEFLGECALGNLSIDEPVPEDFCMDLVRSVWSVDRIFRTAFTNAGRPEPDAFEALCMFANVLAASSGAYTYPCGLAASWDGTVTVHDASAPDGGAGVRDSPSAGDVVPWAHINRVFMVRRGSSVTGRDGTEQVMRAMAAAGRKVTSAQQDNLEKPVRDASGRVVVTDPRPVSSLDHAGALAALEHEHITRRLTVNPQGHRLPPDRYAAMVRINGLPTDQPVLRVNRSLHWVVADRWRQRAIFDLLDLEAYARAAKTNIDTNWVNRRDG